MTRVHPQRVSTSHGPEVRAKPAYGTFEVWRETIGRLSDVHGVSLEVVVSTIHTPSMQAQATVRALCQCSRSSRTLKLYSPATRTACRSTNIITTASHIIVVQQMMVRTALRNSPAPNDAQRYLRNLQPDSFGSPPACPNTNIWKDVCVVFTECQFRVARRHNRDQTTVPVDVDDPAFSLRNREPVH